MKKIKFLGTLGLGLLFIGLASTAHAEDEYYGECGYPTKQYGYTNEFDYALELPIMGIPTFFPNASADPASQFGVFKIKDLEQMESFYGEADMNSIDIVQYAKNLTDADIGGKVSDLRPLGNAKKLKELHIDGPITSLNFIKNLKELKFADLTANSYENNYSDTNDDYKVITDISVFDELDKLESMYLGSYDRPFPTVSLKKEMTKYVLVNPFILSKQFKNASIKITSATPGFTFENDVLTWDNLTPETKELEISWEFKITSNENSYKGRYDGKSTIPLNWK